MSAVAAPPRSPFKGLSAFEDSDLDALFFFGRERERDVIVANMLASRLTVLYGESGVGKSSILRAGVVRELRRLAPTALVEVHDTWSAEDPAAPLAAVRDATEGFLILDQFEEFFLYHGGKNGDDSFVHALGDLLRETGRLHVLVSLREDALAQLDAFDTAIPGIFANRLRLDQLDREAARSAIVGPVSRWNELTGESVVVEPRLAETVLDEVAAGRVELGASGVAGGGMHQETRVGAPYLQLVLERLWEAERSRGSVVLRLATLRELGGAEAIVREHLERALGALPMRDAEIATSALKFLVTPSRTKVAHSFGDLVGYTNESPVELEAVLEALASQRILRAVAGADEEGRRYEIFHDVLAEPVLAWRREFEAQAAVERERRHRRRFGAIALGAALVAAIMSALAIWAVAQRSEVSTQKRAAQAQAELALGQKRLAQHQKAVALAQTQKANQAASAARASEQRARQSEARAKASEQQAKRSETRAETSEQKAKQSKAKAQASEQKAKQSEQKSKQSEAKAKASERQATQDAARAQRSKRFALREQHLALAQAVHARAAARRARVGELLATSAANLGVDPVQSVRAALGAAALAATTRVEDTLRDALVALRARGILDGGGGAVKSAVFSPDGSLVATGALGGEVRVFATRTHKLLRVLKEGSPISRVAFSPDGKTLAAGTRDSRAVLYDARTGQLQRTLRPTGQVLDLVFAGAGRYLVTASPRNVLQVWDAATGELVHAASAPATERAATVLATSRKLAVSADGSLVADVLPADPVVRVYDVGSGALVASLQQPGEATNAGFSPDGSYLITTGRRNAFVWDTHTWTQLHVLAGHEAPITDLAFAPDGRVVTGSVDSSARIWDPGTGASLFTLAAHQQKVLAVAFSHDGAEVATSSADATTRVWKSKTPSIPALLAGHTDAVTGVSFSRDDKLVLTASADGFARLWDARDTALQPLGAQQGGVSTVSYSPDGRLALSGGADGVARIWSTRGGLLQALPHGGRVTQAAFTSGGKDVLTAGDDGTAKLWRVSGGVLLSTFAHGAPVRAAVVVPRADVVTAGDDGTVKLWTPAAKLVWSRTHGSPIAAAVASTDGVVATGAADGTVRLWRARDGFALHVLRGHSGAITSLAFSRDGKLLASGSTDNSARLWDVGTGRLLHRLAGHAFGVTSVAFSPDGRSVLTASVDGDARIWSVESGATVRLLRFHVSTVSQAAFSPDGRWVVTAGPTTAGIWQVRTGRLIYFLGGANGNLTSVAFADDSRRIVTGDTGGGVHAFDCRVCVGISRLEVQAKARLAALD